eukprot:3402028-Prymnesium_polylepis.1
MARAAVCAENASLATAAKLQGVFFLEPLALDASGLHIVCVLAACRFEVRGGAFAACSESTEELTLHCSGGAGDSSQGEWQHLEQAQARGSGTCLRAVAAGALYDSFDEVGLQYGPGYRTLAQTCGGGRGAAARLHTRSTQSGVVVHPASLDDALCLSVLGLERAGGATPLPFAVDDAMLQGAWGERWAVRCLQLPSQRRLCVDCADLVAQVAVRDGDAASIWLCAGGCLPQAQLGGFKTRELRATQLRAAGHLYVTEWRVLENVQSDEASVLVLGDVPSVGGDGCSGLEPKQQSVKPGGTRWQHAVVAVATQSSRLHRLPVAALEAVLAL